jgi:hypothetical protein
MGVHWRQRHGGLSLGDCKGRRHPLALSGMDAMPWAGSGPEILETGQVLGRWAISHIPHLRRPFNPGQFSHWVSRPPLGLSARSDDGRPGESYDWRSITTGGLDIQARLSDVQLESQR